MFLPMGDKGKKIIILFFKKSRNHHRSIHQLGLEQYAKTVCLYYKSKKREKRNFWFNLCHTNHYGNVGSCSGTNRQKGIILCPHFILLKGSISPSGFLYMYSTDSLIFSKKFQVPFQPLEIQQHLTKNKQTNKRNGSYPLFCSVLSLEALDLA